MKIGQFILVTALLSCSTHTIAQNAKKAVEPVSGMSAPNENRIYRYPYDEDTIYRIYTVPKQHTHIQLGPGEGVMEKPALGESSEWRVSGGPRNLYVKPLKNSIQTTMTLVTNKRTYQIQLIAASEKAISPAYFQKVSWYYPEEEDSVRLAAVKEVEEKKEEQSKVEEQFVDKVQLEEIKHDFEITGEAAFKPMAVYRTEKFMFIKLPPNLADLPTIIDIADDGEPTLVDFAMRPNGLIRIARVCKHLLLRSKNQEVHITQKLEKKSAWR